MKERAKHDKSVNISEINDAEYLHDEFWLNQRDLDRTADDLVESFSENESSGSYDSNDILFKE